jgi:Lrp/AsnC family leucine-responsive transcriptional regulator
MPKPQLDRIDRRILAALQADGRISNVDLAEAAALSPSPCLRRMKRLEAEGVVRGYRAVLDRRAVGLPLTVFIELKVDKHSRENMLELEASLARIPEVVACHVVSGVADFIVEVVVPDLDAYEQLMTERLLRLPMIEDLRSNFCIRSVKTDGALPLGHLDAE